MYFSTNDILLALRKHTNPTIAKIIVEIMIEVDYEGGQLDYASFSSEEELVEFLKANTDLRFVDLLKCQPKFSLLQEATLEIVIQDKTITLTFFEAHHCSRVYAMLTEAVK